MRTTIINIDGVDYTEGIVSGSMQLDQIVCDNEFRVGSCCSSKFEVQMYGLPDVTNKDIIVSQDVDGTVYQLFCGKIETSKLAKNGNFREIVAYDMMYWLGSIDISSAWNEYVNEFGSFLLGDFRRHIFNAVGIYPQIVDYNPIHDTVYVSNLPTLTSPLTFKSFLKMYGEATAGVLFFKTFTEISICGIGPYMSDSIYKLANGDEKLYKGSSTFEDSVIPYNKILLCDNLNNVIASEGEGDRVYIIQNNLLINSMYKNSEYMLRDILGFYTSMANLAPAEIDMIVSGRYFVDNEILERPRIGAGSFILNENGILSHFVGESILSGVQLMDETLKCVSIGYTDGGGSGDEMANTATNIRFEQIEKQLTYSGITLIDTVPASGTATSDEIIVPTARVGAEPVITVMTNSNRCFGYRSSCRVSGENTIIKIGVRNVTTTAATNVQIHYHITPQ